MIKICPNCGCKEEENAKFCRVCGSRIDDAPVEPETEFDFGANDINNGVNDQVALPTVPITLDVNKANKHIKEIITMAVLVLIGSLLGFIVNLIDIEDMISLQEDIEYGWSLGFVGYCKAATAVANCYYAVLVLLALLVAAAVVYVVFARKLKKFNFPVYNDDVFGVAKKAFYASIAATVIFGALCITEVVYIAKIVEVQIELQKLFGESDFSIATSVGFLIKDFVIWGCTIVAMVHALKLSKCKQK